MSKSKNLEELIASMSKADKRYFQLHSGRHKGNKHYLSVFNMMEKFSNVSNDNLKKALRQKPYVKHLPVIKSYLYKVLLDSMHTRYDEYSIDFRLYKMVHKVGILYEKGLYKQALALAVKAKKSAYVHEQIELLPELMKWELMLHQATHNAGALKEAIIENIRIGKVLSNLNQYRLLNIQLVAYTQQFEVARSEVQMRIIDKFMHQPLFKTKRTLSVLADFTFYATWSAYYRAKSDINSYYKIMKSQLKLLEDNREKFRGRESRYIQVLNNLFISQGILGKNTEALETIKKMKEIKSSSEKVKEDVFFAVNNNELNLYISTAEYSKGLAVVKGIEDKIQKLKAMPYEQTIALYSTMAYICFGAGQYQRVIKFLRYILDDYRNEARKDIQASARILYLITRYEMEPTDIFIGNIAKSAHYFLTTRQRLYKTEKLIIDFFFKVVRKVGRRKDIDRELINLRDSILKVFQQYPAEKGAIEAFDFLLWIESRIRKIDFAELAKEKSNR